MKTFMILSIFLLLSGCQSMLDIYVESAQMQSNGSKHCNHARNMKPNNGEKFDYYACLRGVDG